MSATLSLPTHPRVRLPLSMQNQPQENAKTLGERLIKEMEIKGQELDLQEKRLILDAIQSGVDSVLKFGFLKKRGGK